MTRKPYRQYAGQTAAQRGYGAAWRKLRTIVLTEQPRCQCGAMATEVDHIIPKARGGTDARANLRGMCATCHRSKSQRDANPAVGRKREPERHPGEV